MERRSLLGWLRNPSSDRGIRFARGTDGWDAWTYARLAELTERTAAGLAAAGVRPGSVVTLLGGSGPEFVAAFFGALRAGATPSPVAPPLAFQDSDAYRAHLRRVLRTARPAVVVTDAFLVAETESLDDAAPPVRTVAELAAAGAPDAADPSPATDDIALLQFSSGSSGAPRAVRITRSALETNVAAIRAWLRWTEDDPFASWLPLHHDMGLVGGLICSVVTGSDLWLLQPEQFIRDPLRYLACLGGAARLSVMPAFGLDLAVRRMAAGALSGLDFSGVRGIVVGAERIDPRTLDTFAALLGPAGLRRDALLPAYGLAEATLAVTGVPVGEGWTSVRLSAGTAGVGQPVVPGMSDSVPVVGCGRPLDGVGVEVVDGEGVPLPSRHVGEIVVRGSSLAAGYLGDDDAAAPLAENGFRTGDAGFLDDGQLFVLGRLGDGLKVRGRMVFSEDLEIALGEAGIPRQRIAVLLGARGGESTAVILAEEADEGVLERAAHLIRQRTDGARVVALGVARGAIARTSSGKPRRRPLWDAFVQGRLTASTMAEDGGSTDRSEELDG